MGQNSISVLQKERNEIKGKYERKKFFFKSQINFVLMLITLLISAFITNLFNIRDDSFLQLVFFIMWLVGFVITLSVTYYSKSIPKVRAILFLYAIVNGINESNLYKSNLKNVAISYAITLGIFLFMILFKKFKIFNLVGLFLIMVAIVYVNKSSISLSFVLLFSLFCFLCFLEFLIVIEYNYRLKNENKYKETEQIKKLELEYIFIQFILFVGAVPNLIKFL